MKRIMAALALVAAMAVTAQAGVVAYIKNEAGSTIKLTDGTCESKGWSRLFASGKGGRTISGCWFYNSDISEVIAVYDDGTTYSYPSTALSLTSYFYAQYGKDSK